MTKINSNEKHSIYISTRLFIYRVRRLFGDILQYYRNFNKLNRSYNNPLKILLFPILGGLLGRAHVINMPRKYWNTLIWVTDIYDLGAELSWADDSLCIAFEGTIFTSNAYDSSLHTVFTEAFQIDEYGIGDARFDGMTILDVGANIGDSAVMFLNKGAYRVHSFEPMPSIFRYLTKTLKLNNIEPYVDTHCVGLSGEDEIVDVWFRQAGSAGSSPTLHTGEDYNRVGYIKESIQLVDTQRYLQKHNISKVDVIKMDCEHCEYVLFRNGRLLQMLNPQLVYLEYHAGPKPLIKVLEKNGYDVRVTEKNPRVGVLYASKSSA